jgi:hypothetical protein
MTGENDSNIKRSNIMLMRDRMKKQRNGLQRAIDMNKLRENKHRNIIRIDIEAQTTGNAYTENECMVIVNRLADEELTGTTGDIRSHLNGSCTPMSNSNLQETDDEFNRRQYKILASLKKRKEMEDAKYANTKK